MLAARLTSIHWQRRAETMTREGSCCWRKFRSLRPETLRSALIPQTRCDKSLLVQAGERHSHRTMIITAKRILCPASTFTIRKCFPFPICSLWVSEEMEKLVWLIELCWLEDLLRGEVTFLLWTVPTHVVKAVEIPPWSLLGKVDVVKDWWVYSALINIPKQHGQ